MATIVSQSISDTDMLLLKNDLYDENNPDNPAHLWVENALTGKINQCYKRMKNQWEDSKKIPFADFIIENKDWNKTIKKIREIHRILSY